MITLITCGIWQFCSRRALQTPDGNKDTGKTNFLSLVCIGKSVLGNWGRNQQCGAEINLKRWAWGEDWVIASLPSPLAMIWLHTHPSIAPGQSSHMERSCCSWLTCAG